MRNKIHVGGDTVSCTESIAEARRMSDFLLQREFRGPGDTIEAAAYRAEQRWGAPATMIQRLRHRDVTDMLLSNWVAIKSAYQAACAYQEKHLEHEVALARASGADETNSIALRTAIRLGGKAEAAE